MHELILTRQKNDEGMTGRIIFDDGNRKDFYCEILELSDEGFQKIAILDPRNLRVFYTRSEAEVNVQFIHSIQNKTMIVAAVTAEPYLMER